MEPSSTPDDVQAAAMQWPSHYDLVAVAASAGGLPALMQILRALPPDFTTPIVIVQHRSARHQQMLPAILKRVSPLRVKSAESGERLSPGTVYIAPADYHLVLQPNHTLYFMDGMRIKFLLASANPLLESAAEVLKERVIAVVLTGGGSDATDGVQAVKKMGGIVIAQNPEEAEHPSMPTSAIQTGAVDYVLSVDEIGPALVRLAHGPNGASAKRRRCHPARVPDRAGAKRREVPDDASPDSELPNGDKR